MPLTKPCMWKDVDQTPALYPVAVERCTIAFFHHTALPQSGLVGGGKGAEMAGKLLDQDGNAVNPCDDYEEGQCPTNEANGFDVSFGVEGVHDIVPVATILRAAGISLDDKDEEEEPQTFGVIKTIGGRYRVWSSTFVDDPMFTKRHAGVVIICEINYSNTVSWDTEKIQYTMTCKHVRNAEFKVLQKVAQTATTEEIYNRHGIRILIKQTGRLGMFSFEQALLALAASIGLIKLSTLIVDNLMMRVLHHKEEFTDLKIAESRDFYSDDDAATDPRFESVAGVPMSVVWRNREFFGIAPPDHAGPFKEVKLHNLNSTGSVSTKDFVDAQTY